MSRPDIGVFAAELVLDRPLRLGETAAAEHRVLLPRDHGPNHCIEYYLLREVTELMIWVRFSPDRLPTRVESYSDLGREADLEPDPADRRHERAARPAPRRARRGGHPLELVTWGLDSTPAADLRRTAARTTRRLPHDAAGCSRAAQSDFSGPNA